MLSRIKASFPSLSRDVLLLNLSTLIASIPVGFLSIILPIYFNKVGLDPVIIGQLYTVSSVATAVLLLIFGVLADRFGRKVFVIAGTALPIVSYIIFLSTSHPLLLTAAACLGGVGLTNGISGALATSSFSAWLTEKSEPANRNLVFALSNAVWTGALMLGSVMSGAPEWLQATFGVGVVDSYRPLFWFSMACVVISTLIVFLVSEQYRPPTGSAINVLQPLTPSTLRTTYKMSLYMGLVGLGLGFCVQLLPLWFYLRFGVSGDVLGPWYAVGELTATLAVFVVPHMTRRWGSIRSACVTMGASACGLVAMMLVPFTWMATSLMVIRTTLVNLAWPVQQSYTMGIVPHHERATVSSATNTAWGLAGAVSPLISGYWLEQRLMDMPILAGAACYLGAALILFIFFRRVRPPEEEEAVSPVPALNAALEEP